MRTRLTTSPDLRRFRNLPVAVLVGVGADWRPRGAACKIISQISPERSGWQGCIHLSYTGCAPDQLYVFTERTHERLNEAGVNALSATDVPYEQQLWFD